MTADPITAPDMKGPLARAFSVLDLIWAQYPVRVPRISRQLELPESTVYRTCRRLRDAGYIVELDGYLSPSERLACSEIRRLHRDTAVRSSRVLTELARTTGMQSVLATRTHLSALCLHAVAPKGLPRYCGRPRGARMPLHADASALPLLAWAPAEIRRRALKVASGTTADPVALADRLRAIEVDGWAAGSSWPTGEAGVLGVPVIRDGECAFSLSLIGSRDRLADVDDLAPLLKDAAAQI